MMIVIEEYSRLRDILADGTFLPGDPRPNNVDVRARRLLSYTQATAGRLGRIIRWRWCDGCCRCCRHGSRRRRDLRRRRRSVRHGGGEGRGGKWRGGEWERRRERRGGANQSPIVYALTTCREVQQREGERALNEFFFAARSVCRVVSCVPHCFRVPCPCVSCVVCPPLVPACWCVLLLTGWRQCEERSRVSRVESMSCCIVLTTHSSSLPLSVRHMTHSTAHDTLHSSTQQGGKMRGTMRGGAEERRSQSSR